MLDKPKLLLTALFIIFSTCSKAQVKYVDSLENTRSFMTMFIDFNVDSLLYYYYGLKKDKNELYNQFIYLSEGEVDSNKCLFIYLESYDTSSKVFDDKEFVRNSYRYLAERTNRYINVRNKFLIPVINEIDTDYCRYNQYPNPKNGIIDHSILSHPEILVYRFKDYKVLGVMGPYGGEIRSIGKDQKK